MEPSPVVAERERKVLSLGQGGKSMKNTVCFCSGKHPYPILKVNGTLFLHHSLQGSLCQSRIISGAIWLESPQGTTKETTEYVIKAPMRNSMEAE